MCGLPSDDRQDKRAACENRRFYGKARICATGSPRSLYVLDCVGGDPTGVESARQHLADVFANLSFDRLPLM
jgi:hypothetical protein